MAKTVNPRKELSPEGRKNLSEAMKAAWARRQGDISIEPIGAIEPFRHKPATIIPVKTPVVRKVRIAPKQQPPKQVKIKARKPGEIKKVKPKMIKIRKPVSAAPTAMELKLRAAVTAAEPWTRIVHTEEEEAIIDAALAELAANPQTPYTSKSDLYRLAQVKLPANRRRRTAPDKLDPVLTDILSRKLQQHTQAIADAFIPEPPPAAAESAPAIEPPADPPPTIETRKPDRTWKEGRRKRIDYTRIEAEQVAVEIRRIHADDLAAGKRRQKKDLWVMAQLVLPEDRRRPACGPMGDWIVDALAGRPLKGKGKDVPEEQRPSVATATMYTRPSTEPLVLVGTPASIAAPAPPVAPPAAPPPPASLASLLTSALSNVILDALAMALRDPRFEMLSGLRQEAVGSALALSPAEDSLRAREAQEEAPTGSLFGVMQRNRRERAGKHKVLVAGPKGHQMQAINDEFAAKYDLRFWATHESSDRLRDLCPRMDAVVSMTSFISHAADAIMQARAVKYFRVDGGVTAIKLQLAKLNFEETVAA